MYEYLTESLSTLNMDYIDNCIAIISECNSCIESCDENVTSKDYEFLYETIQDALYRILKMISDFFKRLMDKLSISFNIGSAKYNYRSLKLRVNAMPPAIRNQVIEIPNFAIIYNKYNNLLTETINAVVFEDSILRIGNFKLRTAYGNKLKEFEDISNAVHAFYGDSKNRNRSLQRLIKLVDVPLKQAPECYNKLKDITSKELYKAHDLCNKIANTTYNKNGVIPEVESTRIKIIMKISQSLVYMFSRITDNIIDMVDARSMVKSPIIDVDLQTYGKVM